MCQWFPVEISIENYIKSSFFYCYERFITRIAYRKASSTLSYHRLLADRSHDDLRNLHSYWLFAWPPRCANDFRLKFRSKIILNYQFRCHEQFVTRIVLYVSGGAKHFQVTTVSSPVVTMTIYFRHRVQRLIIRRVARKPPAAGQQTAAAIFGVCCLDSVPIARLRVRRLYSFNGQTRQNRIDRRKSNFAV